MAGKNDLEIAVLNSISKTVVHERNIPVMLKTVLDILHREMGLLRGTFTLMHGDTLLIEASNGLTEEEMLRGRYKVGEGVTGKVASTGLPRVIPDISKDSEFLGRTRARKNTKNVAFICVPVIHKEKVIGTLSIDREVKHGVNLDRDLKLLETVANITAEAVAACLKEHEEREKLKAENVRLREQLGGSLRPVSIIGSGSAMRTVYSQVAQVAPSKATVLIRGASGTGKELVARAIMQESKRKDKPFICVNCAAIPENLLESELFGHEKGAFTGAIDSRSGRIEEADGGTLFLDEIGVLTHGVQLKLLRFIQERTFLRVGSSDEIRADVRLITATSRNLEQLMEDGKFREDLYYRLNVFPIHLPELTNRKSDIIPLAEYFLEKFKQIHGKEIVRISTPAINMLMSYHWPGNVRELENCMERAVLNSTDNVIHGYNLPPSLQTGDSHDDSVAKSEKADFNTLVESFERELIEDALKTSNGNVAAAARKLGITQRIIHYKINQIGIKPERYKI